MTRVRLGVIADDLTGAADSGVQFADHGFSTLVQLDLNAGPLPEVDDADVLVINTGSRLGSAAAAKMSTKAAIRALERCGRDQFFLKIDSSLRGYVGECVRAALTALPGRVALVAPAYPLQGRVTRGGTQFSGSVPVAEAETGRDGVSPALLSHLPSLLQAAGVDAVQAEADERRADGSVGLTFESVSEAAGEAVSQAPGPAFDAAVFDAEDDGSLRRAVRAGERCQRGVVYVGSAGLARALAEELAGRSRVADGPGWSGQAEPAAWGASHRKEGGPVLTVSGSVKSISRRQVAFAEAAGAEVVRLTAADLVGPDGSVTMARRAAEQLRRAKHVIFTVEEEPAAAPPTGADEPLDVRIAAALGDAAARAVLQAGVQDLILNGGDTALAVCRRLGIRGLWLNGEALDGVPCSSPTTASLDGLRILSKSGGFGSDDTMLRAAAWFASPTRTVDHA